MEWGDFESRLFEKVKIWYACLGRIYAGGEVADIYFLFNHLVSFDVDAFGQIFYPVAFIVGDLEIYVYVFLEKRKNIKA